MPTAAETRAGEIIRTSKDLAAKLARLASEMRVRAREALNAEGGELRKLYNALRAAPICDLGEDDFADVCAQTVACGLLSASIAGRGGAPSADGLKGLLTNTGPFLRELMQTFLTVGSGEISELLSRTRMDEVLKDFDAKNPSEDPVIHFYELFLKEYDPERRMKRGVFYTPRPVVSFIVRSVDEILRADFGLEDGLADTTTWGEFVEREKIRNPKSTFRTPEGVGPEEPFVQILDPATGTGTFLVEVVERIHATMRAKWARRGKPEGEIRALWNEYVPRHLLPRLHGFELMMAPYAVAHMKLGLKLAETKYRFDSAESARVYLTNTLDEPKDFSDYFERMSPALAHEAGAANRVKRRAPVTVVIGNPPYSNISQNMGEWIKSLVEDYRLVEGIRIVEKSKRNHLQDDYVKFIRVAHEYARAAGCGVVGYITNHSYLDSPTFRGMRYSLLSGFDGVRVVNLHGNAKRDRRGLRAGDENVFDIQQGVAITCLSRTPDARAGATHYADLYGTRESKYDFLLTKSITELDAPLSPKAPFFFLAPEARSGARAEYETGWKVDEFMPFGGAGIKTNRDAFVIDFEDEPLRERVGVFADERVGDSEAESVLCLKENYVWKIPKARAAFRRDTNTDRIRDLAYRPFDVRRIYYQKDVVFNPRFETMRQSERGNLYLLTCRQQYSEGFRHVSVCREMFECCVVSAKSREITSGFPLYVYSSAEGGQSSLAHERAANYSGEFLSALKTTTGFQFVSGGRGDLRRTVGPEDVFHYVYAVLHSQTYRARYAEFLKIDFPRVPLTPDAELFRELCALGADLVALHLLEDGYEAASWNASWNASRPASASPLNTRAARFAGEAGAAEVAKGHPVYRDGSVYVNSSGRFEGVAREVWDFQVGGYKVCEKWLKDRRGRTLSDEDFEHYGRVVAALGETVRLMSEIDRAVEARGGWPLGGRREARKS